MNKITQRYVDILSDAGFKAVFGDQRNRDALTDRLNAMLPDDRKVKELTYSTTEIPGFTLSGKSVRLDLRCIGEDGRNFIVEMQCYKQEYFFRRCVEYAAKVYDSGARAGAESGEYNIPPVYFIGLINCSTFGDRSDPRRKDRFISEYTFREKQMMDTPDETIFLIFAELNRFRKQLDECQSLTDKWCYALKHIGELAERPDRLDQKVFEKFFRACEIARFDNEQKLQYVKDMITERDQINIINTARKEGMEKGIEKGRSEERTNIAKAMKSMGMDAETIIKATGLSETEVAEL